MCSGIYELFRFVLIRLRSFNVLTKPLESLPADLRLSSLVVDSFCVFLSKTVIFAFLQSNVVCFDGSDLSKSRSELTGTSLSNPAVLGTISYLVWLTKGLIAIALALLSCYALDLAFGLAMIDVVPGLVLVPVPVYDSPLVYR